MSGPKVSGRSSGFNPQNRFEEISLVPSDEDDRFFPDEDRSERKIETKFFIDTSKTVLAKNDSPDIPFTYSLNPYRGASTAAFTAMPGRRTSTSAFLRDLISNRR